MKFIGHVTHVKLSTKEWLVVTVQAEVSAAVMPLALYVPTVDGAKWTPGTIVTIEVTPHD